MGSGEFCSREHHNQYRLRCGMDRMLEVNKVASLMRRCENPKPLALAARLESAGIPQHGFFEPLMAEWRANGRMEATLRRPPLRLTLAGSAFDSHPLEWPDSRLPLPAAGARALVVQAQAGRALRVSGSAGFRIPKPTAPKTPSREFPPSPQLAMPGMKRGLSPFSCFLPSVAPRACTVGLRGPKVRFPSAPAGPHLEPQRYTQPRRFVPAPAAYQVFPRAASVQFAASESKEY